MSEAKPKTAVVVRELQRSVELVSPFRMNIYVAKGRDLERAFRLLPAKNEHGQLAIALALASIKCTFSERFDPPEQEATPVEDGKEAPPKPEPTYGAEVRWSLEELYELSDLDCFVIMSEVFSGKGSSSGRTSRPSKPKDT